MTQAVVDSEDLAEVQRIKYGDPPAGWGVRLRQRHGYVSPDDLYEATVAGLVAPGCRWLDVGCGRSVFPSNPGLARLLSGRCADFLGVDPDATIEENPFVHRKVRGTLRDVAGAGLFDLATLRMVAEHIADPSSFLGELARLVSPGGAAVVYTVDRRSPAALAARRTPMRWHHAAKRALWKAEEKDTFPVAYRMNDRATLSRLFGEAGFAEASFERLADCSIFARFPLAYRVELAAWRLCRITGVPYPEACLLGVYRRHRPGGSGEGRSG